MGCDIHYKCESAEREPVERLVEIIKRWATENQLPYRMVSLTNCSLREELPWSRPLKPSKSLRLLREIFGENFTLSEDELKQESREFKQELKDYKSCMKYFRLCQEKVDLHGIFIDFCPWDADEMHIPLAQKVDEPDRLRSPDEKERIQTPGGHWMLIHKQDHEMKLAEKAELYSRGQFIFDFHNGGRLIRCAVEPKYQQVTDMTVPCLYLKMEGYWRSVGNYWTLPRFLAWCKMRYLPHLQYSTDKIFPEELQAFYEDEERRKMVASLNEDEFYETLVRRYGVIG
jgi:hypothetical protein